MFYGIRSAHLLLCLFILPVGLGLCGVLLPALGYFPALGSYDLSLRPVQEFLAWPGLSMAVCLSVGAGLLATWLSLLGAICLLLWFWDHPFGRWLLRFAGPFIAVPPTAVAAGLILFLAPSGWLMRLISPELTGFTRPPFWALFPDPHGFGLVLALVIKEIPFILLLCLSALARVPASDMRRITRSLGYGRVSGFILIVWPQIYRQIRLPLLAVLVFAISVVELPLLLGPSLPPPLSVLVFQGFQDADLQQRFAASVGAVVQFALVGLSWVVWRAGEWLLKGLMRLAIWQGQRLPALDMLIWPCGGLALMPLITGLCGLMALIVWSGAGRWPFPADLPLFFSGRAWQQAGPLLVVMAQSMWIAFAASVLANGLMLFWLDRHSAQNRQPQGWVLALIYLPLLVPQISFLFGLQIGVSWAQLDGTYFAVIWVHALFILPYSYLILAPAEAAFDRRYLNLAASFGLPAWKQRVAVKWMLMLPAIGAAFLVGVAVSAALYLPTLFAGAGRITTLTVEAVGQIQGGARAYAAVAVLLQIALPISFYLVVGLALRLRFRKFAAMNGGKA